MGSTAAILVASYGSGNLSTFFSLVFRSTISTTTLSYLFIFPAYIILSYKCPNANRPYKVPGGMIGAWVATILPLIYMAIATYFILIPANSSLVADGIDRVTYELTQFIPLGIIIALTVVFYAWGQSEKKNQDVVVELNLGDGAEITLAD